jgi:hypothetical protein
LSSIELNESMRIEVSEYEFKSSNNCSSIWYIFPDVAGLERNLLSSYVEGILELRVRFSGNYLPHRPEELLRIYEQWARSNSDPPSDQRQNRD